MMMSILILLHGHMYDLLLWLWYRNVNEFLHTAMLYPLMNNHLNKMESVNEAEEGLSTNVVL